MTDEEYKKIIDDFLKIKYDFLLECSTNILRRRRHLNYDLVAELIVFLYSKKSKLEDYIECDMLLAFSLSWMKLQVSHKTTPFSIKYLNYNADETDIIDHSNLGEELSLEDEYIKDLRDIYTDIQIEKILKIHDIYPRLSKVHKILFDAYFIEGLSYDKIKDKYTFFRQRDGKNVYYKSKKSIYNLMKELKDEIKKHL